MRPEVCRKAIRELQSEGLRVIRLVLGFAHIEELLGLEAGYQAEAAVNDDVGSEMEVGSIDGVVVSSGILMTPYFVAVGAEGLVRRYFWVEGEEVSWQTPDPLRVILEGAEFEGWRPTWVRLSEEFRKYAGREVPGVRVSVGALGPHMAFAGDGERIRIMQFESDGITAVFLAVERMGEGPLQEVLGAIRDHVGWGRHRKLRVWPRVRFEAEGWVSRITCDENLCEWEQSLTDLMCGAAGRWDLIEGGLDREAERQQATKDYERPTDWERLG